MINSIDNIDSTFHNTTPMAQQRSHSLGYQVTDMDKTSFKGNNNKTNFWKNIFVPLSIAGLGTYALINFKPIDVSINAKAGDDMIDVG